MAFLAAMGVTVIHGCADPDGGSSSSGQSSGSSSSSSSGGVASGRKNVTQTGSAGAVAKNAQYRMVFTVGQAGPNRATSKAPDLRLQGGLIGLTEHTP
ncbi:MAG: hypothetical protein ABI193_15450 [Minicystis sp.]